MGVLFFWVLGCFVVVAVVVIFIMSLTSSSPNLSDVILPFSHFFFQICNTLSLLRPLTLSADDLISCFMEKLKPIGKELPYSSNKNKNTNINLFILSSSSLEDLST